MGLQLLEREKKVFENNGTAKPQLKEYEYILERILKPEARKNIVEALREKGIKPTSMIDISDGLSSELLHICKNSDKGCRVYLEKIPIDEQTAKMSEEIGIEPSVAALNGGEDYELLFTVTPADCERLLTRKGAPVKITRIGEVTAGAGLWLRDAAGARSPLDPRGWRHEF